MPFFSIVIPVYDREGLIGRAIDSVLSQDFRDFEIVVADDASRDRTREVVRERAARDPRVRLVAHRVNRGVCPARNTGVDAALAPWVIFLDSDDELAPGALALMAGRARAAEPEVALLRFACLWDDGSVSPYPPLEDELWDYAGWIRFLDRTVAYSPETLMCVRRETFESIRWPDDRSFENVYHCDFAQRFLTRAYGDVARLYHADAGNSITFAPDPGSLLRLAPDMARAMRDLLRRHGPAMRVHGPAIYLSTWRSAMKFSLLAGDRLGGLRAGLAVLARRPFSLRAWTVLLCGLIHPVLLARVDAATMRMRLPSLPGARQ
jgi:CDP-glycerol glycerophosphotransferase